MNTKESVKELLLVVNNETTNQWEEITKKVNEDKSLRRNEIKTERQYI